MTKRVTPPRVGRTPDLLRKGGAMRDRTKYTRKGRMQRKWHE